MTNTAVAKETLISMLSEIYSQLEELENEIETSFSNLDNQFRREEMNRILKADQGLTLLEQKAYMVTDKTEADEANRYLDCHQGLKLELGY